MNRYGLLSFGVRDVVGRVYEPILKTIVCINVRIVRSRGDWDDYSVSDVERSVSARLCLYVLACLCYRIGECAITVSTNDST